MYGTVASFVSFWYRVEWNLPNKDFLSAVIHFVTHKYIQTIITFKNILIPVCNVFLCICCFISGFCDPCWHPWHAKGTLKQHRKDPVLLVVKRSRAPQIHEDVAMVSKVRWRSQPPLEIGKQFSYTVY